MEYNISSFKKLKAYIASDLFRYVGKATVKSFIRSWYIAGFRYSFFMRCTRYFATQGMMLKPFFLICRIALRHYSVKYGFQIPWQTEIGPGLYISHYGPIIVNPSAKIGVNCNLTIGVLLGLNHKVDENGKSLGFEYPVVGNRVALGNGVKIIGGVSVGNDCIIGVNSVVTKDIPDMSVAVGQPAKVISERGSAALVGSFHPWTKSKQFN